MVSEKADIPPKEEVEPPRVSDHTENEFHPKIALAKEITESGEAELLLRSGGEPAEVHNYDSHFFPEKGWLYTKGYDSEGDDSVWIHGDDIVVVSRH